MSAKDKNQTDLAKNIKGWINYRPEIKVLDCTVRDGGLMNDHHFKPDFIRSWARFRGGVVGGIYAEAFEVIKVVD